PARPPGPIPHGPARSGRSGRPSATGGCRDRRARWSSLPPPRGNGRGTQLESTACRGPPDSGTGPAGPTSPRVPSPYPGPGPTPSELSRVADLDHAFFGDDVAAGYEPASVGSTTPARYPWPKRSDASFISHL